MAISAIIMAVATLAEAGIKAYQSHKQAQSQAELETERAGLSAEQAERELSLGRERATTIGRDRDRLIARQKALFAKAGVTIEGSPLEVMADTFLNFEQDIINTKFNAETKASFLRSQGSFAKQRAEDIKSGSFFNTASAITGSIGSLASQLKPKPTATNKQAIGSGDLDITGQPAQDLSRKPRIV